MVSDSSPESDSAGSPASGTPASSPKKRSLMPSGPLRRSLRGHGHALSAIVQIGKAGVTGGVVKQLHQALEDHELVKVKVGAESPSDRFEVAERLATEPGVNVVQIVGRTILLYKRHPRVANYEGKRAAPATTATPEETSETSTARPRKGKRKAKAKAKAAAKANSKDKGKGKGKGKPRR
jgi:RNA-binding protein